MDRTTGPRKKKCESGSVSHGPVQSRGMKAETLSPAEADVLRRAIRSHGVYHVAGAARQPDSVIRAAANGAPIRDTSARAIIVALDRITLADEILAEAKAAISEGADPEKAFYRALDRLAREI